MLTALLLPYTFLTAKETQQILTFLLSLLCLFKGNVWTLCILVTVTFQSLINALHFNEPFSIVNKYVLFLNLFQALLATQCSSMKTEMLPVVMKFTSTRSETEQLNTKWLATGQINFISMWASFLFHSHTLKKDWQCFSTTFLCLPLYLW